MSGYYGKQLLSASILQSRRIEKAKKLMRLAWVSGSLTDDAALAIGGALILADRAGVLQDKYVAESEKYRDGMAEHTRAAFDAPRRAPRKGKVAR